MAIIGTVVGTVVGAASGSVKATTVPYNPTTDYQALINKTTNPVLIQQYTEQRAQKIADANQNQLTKWGVNTAGQNVATTPVTPAGPATLTTAEMYTLSQNKINKNDVTVQYSDGGSDKMTGYILDGHTYIINSDGSGTRLLNYGDGQGAYNQTGYSWDGTNSGQYTGSTTVYVQRDGQTVAVQPIYTPTYYPPYIPPQPAFISFNESPPVLSEDLEQVTKYSYFFGLDKLEISKNTVNQNCCFISESITIGELGEDEYIQLESAYDPKGGSVEFSIIDGGIEVPAFPSGDTVVVNEKIFFGLQTRFSIDKTQPVIIRKDGVIVDVSLEKAIQSSDGLYTAEYTPVSDHNYKPINNSVKVKVIIRMYNKTSDSPYVDKIKIRKYGGETLWRQDI